MTNALPLPFPYLPGEQAPDGFEDRAQQNFDALAIALGQAANGLLKTPSGTAWKIDFGFQQFTGLTVTAGGFGLVTVTHSIGNAPAHFFPLVTMQNFASNAQVGVFQGGSMTSTTFQVVVWNFTGSTVTNANVGWALIHD